MVIALRIAGAGYFGGDPQKVMEAPVDIVMDTLDYILFRSEYDRVAFILNQEKR